MNIEIKPVTDHNRAAVLDLKVSEQQKSYVESSKVCLEDAVKCEYYQPAALYYQGDLIGFAMYGLFQGIQKQTKMGEFGLIGSLLMNVFKEEVWVRKCLMP